MYYNVLHKAIISIFGIFCIEIAYKIATRGRDRRDEGDENRPNAAPTAPMTTAALMTVSIKRLRERLNKTRFIVLRRSVSRSRASVQPSRFCYRASRSLRERRKTRLLSNRALFYKPPAPLPPLPPMGAGGVPAVRDRPHVSGGDRCSLFLRCLVGCRPRRRVVDTPTAAKCPAAVSSFSAALPAAVRPPRPLARLRLARAGATGCNVSRRVVCCPPLRSWSAGSSRRANRGRGIALWGAGRARRAAAAEVEAERGSGKFSTFNIYLCKSSTKFLFCLVRFQQLKS